MANLATPLFEGREAVRLAVPVAGQVSVSQFIEVGGFDLPVVVDPADIQAVFEGGVSASPKQCDAFGVNPNCGKS